MALLKYILKKMLMLLPVLVGISIIAFALGIMSPGDPVDQVLNPNGNESYTQAEYDAMAAKMGLDQPAVVQYFNWVDGLAHGDLGRSFFTNKSVMDQLAKRIPISLKLAGFSIILTIVFGVGSGVLMAVKKDRLLDHVLGTFSTVALSVPGFWIAIVLIFIFAEQWKILPSSGISDGSGFILPAITLALPSIGVCARLTRSAILDEIGRQYMTVADAKGMSRRREFIIFVVLSVIGLVLNDGIVLALNAGLGLEANIAKICATALVMVYNFVTRKIFLEGDETK